MKNDSISKILSLLKATGIHIPLSDLPKYTPRDDNNLLGVNTGGCQTVLQTSRNIVMKTKSIFQIKELSLHHRHGPVSNRFVKAKLPML